MNWTLFVGLAITVVALAIAGRRVLFLYRLVANGQPAPDRAAILKDRRGEAAKAQAVEVLGQRKLLKWTVPGIAHVFIFYAFLILASVYVEAYGALFDPSFAIPLIGRWEALGFLQDLVCVLGMLSLATFAYLRWKNSPKKLGTKSRFAGSHLGGAWVTLFMIFNVLWTMLLFRGAAYNTGHLPYDSGAFASIGVGALLEPLGESANEVLEHVGLLLHIGVMLIFLVIVVHSKHLHIFTAPINVSLGRKPTALGSVKPLMINGEPFDLEKIDEIDEDAPLGVGKVEDFSWKGQLDFLTCTECGRCQSQCPAWNTEKPLSPKMVILNLRDHALAKAPYSLASEGEREKLDAAVITEAERPLVGATEGLAWHPDGGAVIDDDVLWSCTTCGACVNQCPVDIEHVDHIVDMRRYQVLIESSFPSELNGLFRALENKGNPWNLAPSARMDWAQGLDFEVKQVGVDVESLDEVEWLFWVGCAGAYEDRAKKTTRAVAELFDMAGVSFAVLGDGETCTGDPARRAGNEFVFQQLAMQNAEMFKETKVKKVVSTCAHCFNTLKNEYAQFGVELEVVHHTQLLNRLVREGKLTPVAASNGTAKKSITYHDPCYLGRHNTVYEPPRELLSVIPSVEVKEMERTKERSFCCGAGGARMWMEESIGERINMNRTEEAVGTGADQIAIGCPFCQVMIADGLTALIDEGKAREEVEVLDVAQMLLASVKREPVEIADGENDNAASITEFPLTVAHDGTIDPEQAPESSQLPPEQPAESSQLPPEQPAESSQLPPEQPADSVDTGPSDSSTLASVGAAVSSAASVVAGAVMGAAAEAVVRAVAGEPSSPDDAPAPARFMRIELPAGEQTAAETWAGLQVESILEGDDVDISEFKAKLKAELKAELLAEVKAELEGALNSDAGASAPVTAETVSTPEADPEPAPASDPEPTPASDPATPPTPAVDPVPAEAPAAGSAPAIAPEEPAASTPAAGDSDKKDGGDPPLLIGSL